MHSEPMINEHHDRCPIPHIANDGLVIGFDIETDTEPSLATSWWPGQRGLDPVITPITAVAFSDGGDGKIAFLADDYGDGERSLLAAVDDHVGRMPTGTTLVGWNSCAFDLPFLAARSAMATLSTGLCLKPVDIWRKYDPEPGMPSAMDGTWHGHRTRDLYQEWHDHLHDAGYPTKLKDLAVAEGLDPITVDRTRMQDLDRQELTDYVTSDATTTAVLAIMHG